MDQAEITAKIAREHKQLMGITGDLRAASAEIPAEDRRDWLEVLKKRFFRFRAHMIHRIALEEVGGFLKHVLELRPSLAKDIEHLRREHRDVLATIEQVQWGLAETAPDDVERLKHIRLQILHVLSAVAHQAEHEDLLISYVHTQDIGGEA